MPVAIKHFDPIVGVDTHLIQPPAPCPPVPIPHPYVGMVFDPAAYLPGVGSTVMISGFYGAKAGTSGQAMPPHIPVGGTFVKPPTNESETFLGSATVAADGDPLVYSGLPILTCQDIGIPAQPRPSKKETPKSLMLPTGNILPIPSGPPALIGGPPSFAAAAEALVEKAALSVAFKKVAALAAKSKKLAAAANKVNRVLEKASDLAHEALEALGIGKGTLLGNALSKQICQWTGHPVDVATGKLMTDQVDFVLPGPIPLAWERTWFSTSTYRGALGHGWHHAYDLALLVAGEVVALRLADGRPVVFLAVAEGEEQYDRRERLTLLRDARGYGVRDRAGLCRRFARVPGGGDVQRLVAIEDSAGHRLSFEYDPEGRLQRFTDSCGRLITVRYDEAGRMVALKGPHPTEATQTARLASYAYDGEGESLVSWRDPSGAEKRYRYEGTQLVQETDRNGLSFHFEYDGEDDLARCVHTWGDGGLYDHRLTFSGPMGELGRTTVVNSLGHVTVYEHRGGAVVTTEDPRGGISAVDRNEHGDVLREADPLGNTTTYAYDARGNLVERVRPDGGTVTVEYDARDRPVRAVDEVAGAWEWRYGADGLLVERRDPLGRRTILSYANGRLSGVREGETLPALTLDYAASGQLARLGAADGTAWRWDYDRLGRVVRSVDARGNVTERTHDPNGRIVRFSQRGGGVRRVAYDPEGNVARVRDDRDDVRFAYRGSRLVRREQGGAEITFCYDTEEQLIAVSNERGDAYAFTLDACGDVVVEAAFDGSRRRYERDLAGRVVRLVKPSGAEIAYAYDGAARPLLARYSDGEVAYFGYRPDGRLMLAGNGATEVTFARDALGRVTREAQGADWVSSALDAEGARTLVTSSRGARVAIERSAMGHAVAVRAGRAKAPPLGPDPRTRAEDLFEATFERDSVGAELKRQLPGGVSARWQRDPLGRPLRQQLFVDDRWRGERSYTWDAAGQLQRVVDASRGPVAYTHDPLGALTSVIYDDGREDLRVPDAVGNLFRTTARTDRVYSATGQLLEARGPSGVTRYTYDQDDQLIEKREPTGRTWRYAWNVSGGLARVVRPDGDVVAFAYDPLGRRTQKRFRGEVTRWVWDGDVPLHEWRERDTLPQVPDPRVPPEARDAELTAERQRDARLASQPSQGPPEAAAHGTPEAPITWVFEPESFAPLGKLLDGQAFGISVDTLGAPAAMFDARGRETWSASVDVYGALRNLRGDPGALPFRWPGQYEDGETGLYYNRFRYYDPERGAYLTRDPIGLEGGLHLTRYVADPTSRFDPLGLAACATWNEFQQRSRGKFRDRAEAGHGWSVYKESSGSVEDLAIGRLADTRAAEELGMRRLNTPAWSLPVNDAWVQGGVDARRPFYLATEPGPASFVTPPGSPYPTTVFFREMNQLGDAAYTRVGTLMVPP